MTYGLHGDATPEPVTARTRQLTRWYCVLKATSVLVRPGESGWFSGRPNPARIGSASRSSVALKATLVWSDGGSCGFTGAVGRGPRFADPEGGAFDDMTIDDHSEVMSKVGIADLKAHLSEHLRNVRRGRIITVLDRDTPVAQIVPYAAETTLDVRRATRKPGDLRLPAPLPGPTDSVSILLQDRASR